MANIGQIFCSTDAPTQGPDKTLNPGFILQGLPANTGYVYVGESSDMTTTDSYPLSAAQQYPLNSVLWVNLNALWFLATVDGEGVAYIAG